MPVERRTTMRLPAALASIAIAGSVLRSGAAAAPLSHCGVEMRNVALHVAEGIVLHVRALDGVFISRSATAPPVFDDPGSYTLKLRTADLSMDAVSLTALLRLGLASRPSPLRDLRVTL